MPVKKKSVTKNVKSSPISTIAGLGVGILIPVTQGMNLKTAALGALISVLGAISTDPKYLAKLIGR